MKQSKPEWPEKKQWKPVSFCCRGTMKTLCFSCNDLCLQPARGDTLSQKHVQSQEAEIPTFSLGAASKVLPAQLIFSRAGSIASISAEVAEHPGASCLTKQAVVVIRKSVFPYKFGHDSSYGSFYSQKGHPCYVSGMVRKPWPSSSKVTQRFGDLAKAWTAGPSTNTVQDSAIFFSALQNKRQNYSKCDQTESRAHLLICRI